MKRALALIILLPLLLSSCSLFGETEDVPPETSVTVEPPPTETPVSATPSPVQSGDGKFSLRYNSGATLNPLVGTDAGNMALSTLMYRGLFRLTSSFELENDLCESYTTSDCITYYFLLRNGIYMSDGSEVTPYDVIYSINTAKSNRYASRLKNISSVSIADAASLKVVLKQADARFPLLLDFGIIKDGSSGTAPRGSGPYKYSDTDGEVSLILNEYYEKVRSLTLEKIYLIECADTELGERFTESAIDVFTDDPNATVVSVRRDHEKRYYNTTVLQYIGFNSRSSVLLDTRFRAVVQYAVDKETIVNSILGTRASVANIALPTFYNLYDRTWEISDNQNALVAMSDLLGQMGMKDANNDTYLEYPLNGDYVNVSLVFLVNSENQARIEAANAILDKLSRIGIKIELLELPYDEFIAALEDGNFDMYYGETMLPANFDFSELISPGGALDYGNMGNVSYNELNSAFLAARGDFAEKNAARDMCTALAHELPFIPVAYKQYAAHSGRNEILGIDPTQTGLYWNIYDWTIDVK